MDEESFQPLPNIPVEEEDDEVKADFYNAHHLQQCVEDDEISAMEEGFMAGYLGIT